MKEEQIVQILEEINREEVPDGLNLWTTVRARMQLRERAASTRATGRQRRWAPALAASLVIALLLVGVLWTVEQPATVSAEEVLERADSALTAQVSGASVIYDRFLVSFQPVGAQGEITVTAELWQDRYGERFRYQLTGDEGELLYFVQRSGDSLWQSAQPHPVGIEATERVYRTTLSWGQFLNRPEPGLRPGGSSLGINLPNLQRLLTQRGQLCVDISCLFGALALEKVEPTLVGTERLGDGRTVYVVELRTLPREAGRVLKTLKIDTSTFTLVEAQDLRVRLRHVERRAHKSGDISAEFFTTVPTGIEVLPWEPDRVWVISASPTPGTRLEGSEQEQVEFEVELGYELRSVPEAALMVRLSHSGLLREARRGGGLPTSSESNPGSEWIPIRADQDRVTVRFTVDLSESSPLGRANRVLWAHIVSGNEPGRFDLLAFESFDEHQWFLVPLSP